MKYNLFIPFGGTQSEQFFTPDGPNDDDSCKDVLFVGSVDSAPHLMVNPPILRGIGVFQPNV